MKYKADKIEEKKLTELNTLIGKVGMKVELHTSASTAFHFQYLNTGKSYIGIFANEIEISKNNYSTTIDLKKKGILVGSITIIK